MYIYIYTYIYKTHLYVWHDSFMCVWHDSFTYKCILQWTLCQIGRNLVWHDSFIRLTWLLIHTCELIYMCDSTHPHTGVYCILLFARLVETLCDMTHSYVWHDSVMCVWHDTLICVARLIYMCVTPLIHMCAMTHSYVCYDSFICVPWPIHIICVKYVWFTHRRLIHMQGSHWFFSSCATHMRWLRSVGSIKV